MFQRAGYRVKILNTINFSKSMKYNPFVYIHSEKDVLKLVNTLIANTKGEGEKSAEDFWVKSERLFYTALIGYIWYEAPAEEMNFTTLLEMINASEAREDDPEFQSPVDHERGVLPQCRSGLRQLLSLPCAYRTSGCCSGCDQKSQKVRLLHEDALIVQNMGR